MTVICANNSYLDHRLHYADHPDDTNNNSSPVSPEEEENVVGVSRKLGEEMKSLVAQIKSLVEVNAVKKIDGVTFDNLVVLGRNALSFSGFITGVRERILIHIQRCLCKWELKWLRSMVSNGSY